MPNTPLPDPNATLGKCSRCGADIKIDAVWYRFLVAVRDALKGV